MNNITKILYAMVLTVFLAGSVYACETESQTDNQTTVTDVAK